MGSAQLSQFHPDCPGLNDTWHEASNAHLNVSHPRSLFSAHKGTMTLAPVWIARTSSFLSHVGVEAAVVGTRWKGGPGCDSITYASELHSLIGGVRVILPDTRGDGCDHKTIRQAAFLSATSSARDREIVRHTVLSGSPTNCPSPPPPISLVET